MDLTELEKSAYRGDTMPDRLTQPEQLLFLSFRVLYREHRAGVVDRGQAKTEKVKLLESYRTADFQRRVNAEMTSRYTRLNRQVSLIEKNGCEMCKLAVRIFDGRERGRDDA